MVQMLFDIAVRVQTRVPKHQRPLAKHWVVYEKQRCGQGDALVGTTRQMAMPVIRNF